MHMHEYMTDLSPDGNHNFIKQICFADFAYSHYPVCVCVTFCINVYCLVAKILKKN